MKERPILFSAEMVRALLREDNPKSMTRRVIKNAPAVLDQPGILPSLIEAYKTAWVKTCPYGQPGDLLWVKETWACLDPANKTPVIYAADRGPKDYRWKSPIFMPRWASRITLEITAVRVERVQEIQGADLIAEGVGRGGLSDDFAEDLEDFKKLWDSLNAKRGYGWDVNDWVRVISFRRLP